MFSINPGKISIVNSRNCDRLPPAGYLDLYSTLKIFDEGLGGELIPVI